MPLVSEIYVFTTEFCHEWHIVRRSRTNNKYSPLFKDTVSAVGAFEKGNSGRIPFLTLVERPVLLGVAYLLLVRLRLTI